MSWDKEKENVSPSGNKISPFNAWSFPPQTAKGYGSIGGSLAGKLGDNQYTTDYALRGCKCADVKCEKGPICPGELRIGKIPPSLHKDSSSGPKQTKWYHPVCMFASFQRVKASTNTIMSADDLSFFSTLNQPDQDFVKELITAHAQAKSSGAKRDRSEYMSLKSPAPLPPATPETLEREEVARHALYLLAACGAAMEMEARSPLEGEPEAKRLKL